ncbi:MAG: GCN5-related N-acetyltransferase [Frankiales bacterium]|nr:GCN5-related N-acetyltransferase [Frankiales bacterium]
MDREVTHGRYDEGGSDFRDRPSFSVPAAVVTFTESSLDSAEALPFVEALNAYTSGLYPNPDDRHWTFSHEEGIFVVAHLTEYARSVGARELRLETGTLLEPAVRLYERCGFREIPRYGEYENSPASHCMGKLL